MDTLTDEVAKVSVKPKVAGKQQGTVKTTPGVPAPPKQTNSGSLGNAEVATAKENIGIAPNSVGAGRPPERPANGDQSRPVSSKGETSSQSRPASSSGDKRTNGSSGFVPTPAKPFRDGLCYMVLFKKEYRQDVFKELEAKTSHGTTGYGNFPFKRMLVEVARDHKEWIANSTVRITAVFGDLGNNNVKPMLFHIRPGGDTPASSFLMDTSFSGCKVGAEVDPGLFKCRVNFPLTLREQRDLNPDFTVCRCQVHIRPASLDLTDKKGCSNKSIGKHPTIRAAAEKKNKMCHAEEATRRNDRRKLDLVLSGEPEEYSYKCFEGLKVSTDLESSNPAPFADFGAGYCGLDVIRPCSRWRDARLLGPDCRLDDFYKVFKYSGLAAFKRRLLIPVGGPFYHVVTDPSAKGIDPLGGELFAREIERVLAERPDARIGSGVSGDTYSGLMVYPPPDTFGDPRHIEEVIWDLREDVVNGVACGEYWTLRPRGKHIQMYRHSFDEAMLWEPCHEEVSLDMTLEDMLAQYHAGEDLSGFSVLAREEEDVCFKAFFDDERGCWMDRNRMLRLLKARLESLDKLDPGDWTHMILDDPVWDGTYYNWHVERPSTATDACAESIDIEEAIRRMESWSFPKVGGYGDCWKALFFDGEDGPDEPKLLSDLVDEFDIFLAACHIEIPPIQLDQYRLTLSQQGEMLHIELYKRRWAEINLPKGSFFSFPEFAEYLRDVHNLYQEHGFKVGLTTAVVMGTIGDVEPTLDVVATNYYAAEMESKPPPVPVEEQYTFTEGNGHGWMASDFFQVCDGFSKSLFDKFGSIKGDLTVSPALWNLICEAWQGEKIVSPDDNDPYVVPGSFVTELSEDSEWVKVPDRPVGQHKRIMPDDFVLITHPDHLARFADEQWETVALPMESGPFIKLGQNILEKGLFAVSDMKAMHETLFEHIKAAMPVCEQSDLIYLVSGTTFHYFLASVFPEKNVYEVCPVPREDNGHCPEFYLGHYFRDLSVDPSFGFKVGRLYNQWLTAPKYLNELEWEGEFKYIEPPKYHSIAPWAADRWQIASPNVGFKPYSDFIRKTSFIEQDVISGYFSLGSCESITKQTKAVLDWLRRLPVKWTVDKRWAYLFEGTSFVTAPYIDHATYLHKFDWVVHHGGSGVTNTCCAVGVPQTILPQIGDQFIWEAELRNHVVKPLTDEAELRALLFHQRKDPVRLSSWSRPVLDGPDWWLDALKDNGASPVAPFKLMNHCCHDWDMYGWKPCDLVIGESKDWWFTIFNSAWERSEEENTLKFVRKVCEPTGSPLVGWSGFVLTQTYPEHAHGWLSSKRLLDSPVTRKAFPGKHLDANDNQTMLEFAKHDLASRSKNNPYNKMLPRNVDCSCGGRGYDFGNKCERCALLELKGGKLDPSTIGELVNSVYKGFKPRVKPCKKNVTFRISPGYVSIRSRKRYYQLDSRCIKKAQSPQLARALLDQITDMSDCANVEAFWMYTSTKPPHYTYKTSQVRLQQLVDDQARLHVGVSIGTLGTEVVKALGNVLSVGSFRSIYQRLNLNLATIQGRDFVKKRWWVLIDGLRHFDEFTRTLGIEAMPQLAKQAFPPIESAEVLSVIPSSFALSRPLRSTVAGSLWLKDMRAQKASIRVHLFALRLPALGKDFGVFHAVVEHDGWYWELQQVNGERCHINRTRFKPEATRDRPLVKTVLVRNDIVGSLDLKRIDREFSGIGYKVLGDNCLVFANMLVFLLTHKVIPWRHFGAFGKDLSLDVHKECLKWASSHFFLQEDEQRLQTRDSNSAGLTHEGPIVRSLKSWTGPKAVIRDYGIKCVQRVEAALEAYTDDPDIDCPQERDHMIDFMSFAVSKFGLSGAILSKSIMTRRVRRIPTSGRKWRFLNHLLILFRQCGQTRFAEDFKGVLTATANLKGSLRKGKKVGWTPILSINVPRHWFRSGNRLVETRHLPENLNMTKKQIVRLDLPQIAAKYRKYFPGAEFPDVGFKWIRPGEYEIGVKVMIRKDLPKMDELTKKLCEELQEMHPFELGVFSLRFGTAQMAEKVTDRYFTGGFEPGQLIPEVDQEEIAQAIYDNENHLFKDTQLISPEEVWKKWHRNYSAGFPFRFNKKGNVQRQKLIDAVGGKEAFLQCVRNYIESPEAFPTVSHAFIKDEVLPQSYIEREKIRTIIAQDPLNYYLSMAVQGDSAKRLDPTSFSAVGVSASHGEMSALAEKHLAYEHHTAMDVTAMDSTAAVDAVGVIKKLRKLGFKNHPQREAIETAVDATYDNLIASWIIDIHSGRARLKKQGLSTGHATTTPSNTEYMRVLMLYAWKNITGRPYSEFYDCVKFSSFSDDNFWSTSLPSSVFSGTKVSDFWLSRGVQVRVEGASDDLSDLSFLAKKFSFNPAHLDEVETYTGIRPKVAIVHDINRLLTKFSDYKKKNTLRYRWEKFAALQLNCAHYPDVHSKVDEYLDVLEKLLLKRQSGRNFIKQHPRTAYADVMRLMYVPTDKTRSGLIVTTHQQSVTERIKDWWDTTRVDIMTFDSTANTYGRILSQFAGLLEIGGLNIEDPGLFLKSSGEIEHDPEFTLEHHLYLLNGCPESFEKMEMLAQKTPFSTFMDIPGFWARREYYDVSEKMGNALRVKVGLLLGIYTLVAWLEQALMSVPIIGPLYRLLATAKYVSEKLYSRLNSLYYAMFGDSSVVISSMMPKDRYYALKVIAYRLWSCTTSIDAFSFEGGVDNAQEWVDSIIKFGQDIHQIVLDFDISPFLPQPGTGERDKQGITTNWTAIDHTAQVLEAQELLHCGRNPMITGPPGAGKSTDFVLCLKDKYETVIVACPRQILVKNNPIAQTRLYAGCEDNFTRGYINFGTAGYLRRILSDLPDNTIIVIDEFHELDEDSLWLLDRYRENCIVVTATPNFYGAQRFVEVRLTKGRNARWSIMDDLRDGKGTLQEGWDALLTFRETNDRVLFILPRIKDVEAAERHAQQLVPGKRCCSLYRGNNNVIEADWYFATSVVDAGINIPGVSVVIDTGQSLGYKNGKFVCRPSSHNISAQRRGRTGRTCNGTYIRLISQYDDSNWDFSTPFLCNSWSTAVKWDPSFKRGRAKKTGMLESLPSGYEQLFGKSDWSPILYSVFLYESRLDVNRARASYQAMRKFPMAKQYSHLTGRIENFAFDDLHIVEDKLKRFRLEGETGNFWNWNLSESVLLDFNIPVPSHLLDTY